jgi:C1A family cysteine protease
MWKELVVVLGLLNFSSGSDLFDRFKSWASIHNVAFKDNTHLVHIFDNWVSNDNYIQEINSKNLTWTAAHNAWSGMSLDEFVQWMGLDSKLPDNYFGTEFSQIQSEQTSNSLTLPTSWDWRAKGVVSPIRDQGQCGSCWAFSGTSTIESAVAIKTGVLNDLSEQQGVDCSTIKEGYKNMGCNGGWYYDLWDYVKANGGLTSETCYPYTSGVTKSTGTCKKTCSSVANTKVVSQVVVTPYSDTAMLNGLYVNPVSVAIEADTRAFQLYSSGVFKDSGCGTTLDHAVVLVGWGTDTVGGDYYILRNSWGTTWGESGYMKIARGSAYGKAGECGVLSKPYYPVV